MIGTKGQVSLAIDRAADPDLLVATIEDDGSGPPEDVTLGMGLDGIVAFGGSWRMAPHRGGGRRFP